MTSIVLAITMLLNSAVAQSTSSDSDSDQVEEETLPKISEMETPTAAELLQNPPVDWIVLARGHFHVLCTAARPISFDMDAVQLTIGDDPVIGHDARRIHGVSEPSDGVTHRHPHASVCDVLNRRRSISHCFRSPRS